MKIKLILLIAIVSLASIFATAEAKIIKLGGDVTIEEGQEVDSVLVIGGQATVSGLVEKNVVVVSGSIILTSQAVVRGDVIVVGGVVAKGNGSQVFGDITEINSSNLSAALFSALRGDWEGWSLIISFISVCFFAIILMMALLMAFLLPRALLAVTGSIQTHKGKSFLWGFLATLLMVPFFMLLVLSIIGIFLIPLAFTILLLAVIVGFIGAGAFLGHLVISRIFRSHQRSLVKETLVGLVLLWLLGWLPFYIGVGIKFLAITFGLGGLLLALFDRKAHKTVPPPDAVTIQPLNSTPA